MQSHETVFTKGFTIHRARFATATPSHRPTTRIRRRIGSIKQNRVLPMFSLKHRKVYWILKSRFTKTRFLLQRLYYRSIQRAGRSRDEISVFRFLAGKAFASALLGLLILVLLIVFDHFVSKIGTSDFALFRRLVELHANLQQQILRHNDLVRDTLIAIASLSGLLLGLYFTAISVVVSSRFVAISPGMREHFLREPGGRQYLRILAVTTVWGLLLLGYTIFGGTIGLVSLLAVLLLGMLGIAGFLYLSVRAFYFLDPTTLSDTLFAELIKSARLASSHGRMWTEGAFQNHFRQQAVSELNSLESLLELSSQESHLTRDSLRVLLAKCALFLEEYLKLRFCIPSESLWYKRIPRHENYFLADDTRLTMAVQAGGYVPPKEVPDHFWLEKDIINAMSRSLSLLPSERRLKVTYTALIQFHKYCESLGLSLEVRNGRSLIAELLRPISTEMTSVAPETMEQREMSLASYDASRLSYLSIVLGCLKFMASLDLRQVVDRCTHVDWSSEHGIYELRLPPGILKSIEELQNSLQFERIVEKGVISPDWYVVQLILKHLLDRYYDSLEASLEILDEDFVEPARALVAEGKFVFAAFHCQRGLELCSKLLAHLPRIEQVWQDSEQYRIEKEIPWTSPDWQKVRDRIETARKSIVGSLANCLPSFSQSDRDDTLPDLFGQGYNIVCWETYQSLIENDSNRFADLFPVLALSAMQAYDKLRKELHGWLPETQIAIAGDPLLDVLDISAYAIVYSELYQNPAIWPSCEKVWASLLKTHAKPQALLAHLITLYEYRHGDLRISPRQTIRTRWKLSLNQKLQELGFISDVLRPGYLHGINQHTAHKSKLITVLCRGGHEPLVPIAEVFIVQYVIKRPEGKEITFSDKYGLKRSLDGEANPLESDE
ncbi:membrane hypothetical protein [Candidatus Zixiibacteriota bacterium]|nr:membrane hypothetical protein [candidate division Zixibacteria bacterium]